MNSSLIIVTLVTTAALAAADLTVYPPVPGLAASEHYKLRVRPADGEWQSTFAWQTACKKLDDKSDACFDSIAGCHRLGHFSESGIGKRPSQPHHV